MGTSAPMRAWQLIGGGLLVVTGFMAAAPYLGPRLGFVVITLARIEFVSHVLPALPALAVAGVLVVRGRASFLLAAVLFFAALWNVGTHLPLLGQAADGLVDWPSALWHSVPGIILLVAGTALLATTWHREARATRAGASDER